MYPVSSLVVAQACMYLGLSSWDWITWGHSFLQMTQSSPKAMYLGLGPCVISSSILKSLYLKVNWWCHFFRSCLGDHSVNISWVPIHVIQIIHHLSVNILVLFLSQTFCPLFCDARWTLDVEVALSVYQFGIGIPGSYSCHFGKLWNSVMISVYWGALLWRVVMSCGRYTQPWA